jgi:chromosome segregation ATPase
MDEARDKTVAEVAEADAARKRAESNQSEMRTAIEHANKERQMLSEQLDAARSEATRLRNEFHTRRREDHSKRLGTIDMLMTEASGLARRLEEAKADVVREVGREDHLGPGYASQRHSVTPEPNRGVGGSFSGGGGLGGSHSWGYDG